MSLTPEQERELRRLIEDEGVSEEQARHLVTEIQLDVPLDGEGNSLIKLPPAWAAKPPSRDPGGQGGPLVR